MPNREPRIFRKNIPYLINQETPGGLTMFPSVSLQCHFLHKLIQLKQEHRFAVLTYGLGGQRVSLIVVPKHPGLNKALHSLFTSLAKQYRNSFGGKGYLFTGPYSSQPLPRDKDLKKCQSSIQRKFSKYPDGLFSSSVSTDRFGICGNPDYRPINWYAYQGNKRLFKNGYPTINWYLEMYDFLRSSNQ